MTVLSRFNDLLSLAAAAMKASEAHAARSTRRTKASKAKADDLMGVRLYYAQLLVRHAAANHAELDGVLGRHLDEVDGNRA